MPGKVGSLPNMSGCPTPNAQILGGSTCSSMFAGRNHPQLTQSDDTNHHEFTHIQSHGFCYFQDSRRKKLHTQLDCDIAMLNPQTSLIIVAAT